LRRPLPFWLSETAGTFLRYLAVGISFIPAGLLYSVAVLAGWDHWLVGLVCLGLGFATASVVWKKGEHWEVRIMRQEQRTGQGATVLLWVRERPWVQVSATSPGQPEAREAVTPAPVYKPPPIRLYQPTIAEHQ